LDATAWLQFALGLLLLFAGGELLVRGASGLARRAGISPLVVGLTVVAYGTSAPELVVTTSAALGGHDDVAVGNVVGSNIFNVLFILGACALLQPLVVAQQLVLRDVPILIAASLALLLFALDGRLGIGEGLLLCAGAVWFTVDSIRASRRESAVVRAEYDAAVPDAPRGRAAAAVALMVGGLLLLVAGGRVLVAAAVAIAHAVGLDETVIALTIVSAGTGLPEVATSAIATLRGERDIAVGNVVGSSIFNILAILGVASLAAGGGGLAVAPAVESFDLPVMTAVAVACLPLMARQHRLERWEGALFLGYYAAYTAYLLLAAQQHAALPRFSAVMLEFVLPLTVATVVAVGLASRRAAAPPPGGDAS
jgi:cation:H+ antiporter